MPLLALFAALGIAVAIALLAASMRYSDAYRIAIDHAGHHALPGSRIDLDPDSLRERIQALHQEGRAAYAQLLARDYWLVSLIWLLFIALAWSAWVRPQARAWSIWLAAAGSAYAACDLAENLLLQRLTAPALVADPALAGWATAATAGKLVMLAAGGALVLAYLARIARPWRPWLEAFFIDIPFLIDSAWRRIDFNLHCEIDWAGAGAGERLPLRSCWRKPPFWAFAAVVVFVAYGPTLDGVCTVAPFPHVGKVLLAGAALVLLGTLWRLGTAAARHVRDRVQARAQQLLDSGIAAEVVAQRCGLARLAMSVGTLLLLAPLLFGGLYALALAFEGNGACADWRFSPTSLGRLALCLAAIGAFAAACSTVTSTRNLIGVQAALLSIVALVLWFGLAAPGATEASEEPYRHVFAVVAPPVVLLLLLAPPLARVFLRPALEPEAGIALHFRGLLPRRELFEGRSEEPVLDPARVVHAFTQGVVRRPLQLLLPPALLAYTAPGDWLAGMTIGGFVLSAFLSTWGNMSSRWHHMVLQVERWFLRGTALVVTLFVVAMAALRWAGVDYVTTILDAAPFGALFGVVAMGYLLSWLFEYWLNRAVGVQLLELLGGARDQAQLAYPFAADEQRTSAVRPDGRRIAYHALGRFLVVGSLPSRDAGPAFHSYGLHELFEELDRGADHAKLSEIVRRTDLYFYSVNALLVLLIAALFAGHRALVGGAPPEPMVVASAHARAEDGRDLAAMLAASPDAADPALVVVASGGGTRAALYTAHVLQGLHRLGADRNIVLVSGVSGGGAALAYFVANYRALRDAPAHDPAPWKEFTERVSEDFIRDVLEGASESRIAGRTPLSALLAESFARRLFENRPHDFRQPGAPALILNTTVTGHPIEESRTLMTSVDAGPLGGGDACLEHERPFKLMNGGRLIFTDLRSTGAFPGRESIVADIRLPYQVVRDPAVPLAQAAALSANFPPVFPNARVVLRDYAADADCPDRSFYVTDGGAQENLGLVSALYALQSALEDLERVCPAPCRKPLRPIHIVIAEASSVDFDYSDDRGVSTGLSGARERLTGGVTDMLHRHVEDIYRRLSGAARGQTAVRLHYVALPLAFRARGGFGTHWMHAGRVTLTDPRTRDVQGGAGWLKAGSRAARVTLDREELGLLWTAMHDPDRHFCANLDYGNLRTDRVRRWICGTPRAPGDELFARDLHVEAWDTLVRSLRGEPPRPG